MRRRIGLLSIVGFFGLVTAADAQTPSSTAGAPFDGTYRFVSSAKVNQTYTARNGRMGPCADRRAGPLHVAKSLARYTTATGYRLTGTVGPQGELAMRAIAPVHPIISPFSPHRARQPIDLSVNGTVDGAGTARVRQLSHSCSYEFVWQKASR